MIRAEVFIGIFFYTLVFSLLLYNCFIDFKIGLLTNKINGLIVIFSFLYKIYIATVGVSYFYCDLAKDVLLSFIVYGILELFRIATKNSIGGGDIKTYSVLAFVFGILPTIWILALSNCLAVVTYMIHKVYNCNEKISLYIFDRGYIAMGPYIFLASCVVVVRELL